ncbi:uncharacterized protein A4U43_C04F8610 [Asparagus officinalis]|uniref:GIR1-like zinc ribbon domain-containing protein n=1 Tax=Asparagus officinalis TaxID=4686 RepID=A0A5P1EZR9_ASPOF|nr:uncharacterized protein A4U43_C04F8610 [Asparagus officinalis]
MMVDPVLAAINQADSSSQCKISSKLAMSHHNNKGKSLKPELKLNLSLLPRGEPSSLMRMETDENDDDSPNRMSISSSSEMSLISPLSSCVSSENSPETSKSMVLAGCPRCLMYVMLSEDEEPKCPKCKNAVLLDFNHDKKNKKNGKF